MRATVEDLLQVVERYSEKFGHISELEFLFSPSPEKWSRKEVLGHLIDSAQNNLRRFITGQYEQSPPRILYEQDFWVQASGYRDVPAKDLIQMWKLMNEQIARVLINMPAGNYSRQCDTGHQKSNLRSLEWLAEDYVRHMKHHINQIIAGSFDLVYK